MCVSILAVLCPQDGRHDLHGRFLRCGASAKAGPAPLRLPTSRRELAATPGRSGPHTGMTRETSIEPVAEAPAQATAPPRGTHILRCRGSSSSHFPIKAGFAQAQNRRGRSGRFDGVDLLGRAVARRAGYVGRIPAAARRRSRPEPSSNSSSSRPAGRIVFERRRTSTSTILPSPDAPDPTRRPDPLPGTRTPDRLNPRMTVREIVAEPDRFGSNKLYRGCRGSRSRGGVALRYKSAMGVPSTATEFLTEFSGGQRQRIGFGTRGHVA
jgi:hypothetical protein